MPNGQDSSGHTVEGGQVRVQTKARPWTGLILGILLGLSIAVILQQAGVWPLDRLLAFGTAGVFGLIGILMSGWGRERASAFSFLFPMVIAVGLIAWGATGVADLDEPGELNGGCTVEAQSDVDSTIVTDTTRGNPFEIDPDGGLTWHATSPAPIMNHTWEIWVDVGGFPIVLADGGEENSAGDTENSGEVSNINELVDEVSDISGQVIRGVFEVGGDISGDGGACDGFAFVKLTADPFSTTVSQIAALVGLISLISLIVLASRRTRLADVVPDEGAAVAGSAAAAAPPPEPDEPIDATPEEPGPVEPASEGPGDGETTPPATPGWDEEDRDVPPTT
jgi:hypothetical protein